MVVLTLDFLMLVFFYRDQLKKNYNLRNYFLEVDLDDLAHYDPDLSEKLYNFPSEHLPLVNYFLSKCSKLTYLNSE